MTGVAPVGMIRIRPTVAESVRAWTDMRHPVKTEGRRIDGAIHGDAARRAWLAINAIAIRADG